MVLLYTTVMTDWGKASVDLSIGALAFVQSIADDLASLKIIPSSGK